MPTVSYDAQSLLIDGRRIWLVSGAIHYARVPRGQWRARLRAARQAGLNCIDTYVFWNLHEPRPGVFAFEGENDLRSFVKMVGEEGMYCILRPGPSVAAGWDMGGLPAWLLRLPEIKLRQANGPFMEATARYLGALMEEVRDLQVSSVAGPGGATAAIGGGGGPIVAMQIEHGWGCHNPVQGEQYLLELARYLRENGCQVPLLLSNRLWQRVEGTIDTWGGHEGLFADLRQLGAVQPYAPRIVSMLAVGGSSFWDQPWRSRRGAEAALYHLASALAAAGQYNVYMFHAGTNFGFWGGRAPTGPADFLTTSYDHDPPLSDGGGRGAKYAAVKKISTFASQFAQTLAHLDPGRHHSTPALTQAEHPPAVVHLHGTQGEVAFIFRGAHDATQELPVVLPNGITLPVPLGRDRVAWLLYNAALGGVATLDYTNLRPWAFLGRKMLVLFGPAGATGLVSLNDAVTEITVSDQQPTVATHEGLTLVALSETMIDRTWITAGSTLVIGADELDEHDEPVVWDKPAALWRIDLEGQVKRGQARPAKAPTAPRLAPWHSAAVTEMLDGSSSAYQPCDGPKAMEQLKHDRGYGWYRLRGIKSAGGTKVLVTGGDRLHFFAQGKGPQVLGLGPGTSPSPGKLALSAQTVVLADNLGRLTNGWQLGEPKGLSDHLYQVKPVPLGKPKVVAGKMPDPFVLSAFWAGLRVGDHSPADALVWSLSGGRERSAKHADTALPWFIEFHDTPGNLMVLVNNKPLTCYSQQHSGHWLRLTIPGAMFKSGVNELKLALFGQVADAKEVARITSTLQVYQATDNLTAAAEWAFAPWAVPAAGAYQPLSASAKGKGGLPCWYRTTFTAPATDMPLWVELRGLSKGQMFLNGVNLGRYFVATAAGKKVPPQERYYLPQAWLKTDGPNELVLFDEHGRAPVSGTVRLVYDRHAPNENG